MASKFGPSGTLYFMKERDRFDGSTFPFVKIGIVKGDADVARREKEHQTGNPRVIYSHKEISTPAVQMLETFMHNFFASERIKGEWFRDEHLDRMVVEAEKRAMELEVTEQFHARIEGLNDLATMPDFNPCNSAVTEADVARRWLLDSQLKNHMKQRKAISDRMVELWDEDRNDFFQKTTRKPKSEFQGGIAKKLYPELHKQFVEEAQVWKRVWVGPENQGSAVTEEASSGMSGLLSSDSLADLHGAYLMAWSKAADIEWELVNLEARLITELGTYASLDQNGVTVLKWEKKSSLSFNKAAFCETYPQEAANCMKSDPGGDSYTAAEWKSYS